MLPASELAQAASAAALKEPGATLNYGAPEGYLPLRRWIGERYGAPPERVLLTNGSLQGLALLAELLRGSHVAVEAPTYDRALLTFKRFGNTASSVPMDQDGIEIPAVEGLEKLDLLYTVPNFQNPAAVTMSAERREKLVALAARRGFYVLEDDPYRDVRFAGSQLPTMLSLDKAEKVIYATSFTKSVAPGVRVGAFILPPALMDKMKKLAMDTYVSPGYFAEATVATYIEQGHFEPGLRRISEALRKRRDALVAAIHKHFGDRADFRFGVPEGGYFLWLRLPGVDTDALFAKAEAAGVPFVKGTACYPDGRGKDELRLAFSQAPAEAMDEAVSRLASCL